MPRAGHESHTDQRAVGPMGSGSERKNLSGFHSGEPGERTAAGWARLPARLLLR